MANYRDIDFNLIPLPTTKDISTILDANAIATSIENLVLTNFFERPFHPDLGGDVYNFLFLNFDTSLANTAATIIQDMLTHYEPRAINYQVSVEAVAKTLNILVNFTLTDGNTYQVIVKASRTL